MSDWDRVGSSGVIIDFCYRHDSFTDRSVECAHVPIYVPTACCSVSRRTPFASVRLRVVCNSFILLIPWETYPTRRRAICLLLSVANTFGLAVISTLFRQYCHVALAAGFQRSYHAWHKLSKKAKNCFSQARVVQNRPYLWQPLAALIVSLDIFFQSADAQHSLSGPERLPWPVNFIFSLCSPMIWIFIAQEFS